MNYLFCSPCGPKSCSIGPSSNVVGSFNPLNFHHSGCGSWSQPCAHILVKIQNEQHNTKNGIHDGMAKFYNPKQVQTFDHKMNNLKIKLCMRNKKQEVQH